MNYSAKYARRLKKYSSPGYSNPIRIYFRRNRLTGYFSKEGKNTTRLTIHYWLPQGYRDPARIC